MASVIKDFQVKKGLIVGSGEIKSLAAAVSLFDDATSVALGAAGTTTTLAGALSVSGGITGSLNGTASTATALETARTISLTGDVAGSVSFDGTANAEIAVTIQPNSVTLGTDTTGDYVATVSSNDAHLTVTGTGETAGVQIITDATELNTAGAIVSRDASGNFSAGTITAALSGVAAEATALETARDFSISGDVVATAVSFDGTGNVSLTSDIASAAVTTDKIADSAVSTAKLATASVTSGKIADANVTTAKLANAAVTSEKIAADAVTLGTQTTGDYVATVTAGSGLTVSGSGESAAVTIGHADTSSQASVTNTGGVVIQSVALDEFGHVTGLNSLDLDTRYFTEAEADNRYVNVTGDTITGSLTVDQDMTVNGNLTVNGTTTSVNSTVTTIDDPVITLGANSTSTADGKDRGVEFKYGDGSTIKTGFFGRDETDGRFKYIPDASNSSEVFSGAVGVIEAGEFVGPLTGNATTASALETARSITLGGDATGAVSFDGSTDVTLNLEVVDNSHNHVAANITDFDEAAQDAAAALLTGGTHEGVEFVYDDAANKLNVTVTGSAETETVVADTSATSVFAYDAAANRSAKFLIQAEHATSGFQALEVLAVHNGTDVHAAEYANIFTGASELATFEVDIVGGNVVLTATPVNSNTTFKVKAELISAS